MGIAGISQELAAFLSTRIAALVGQGRDVQRSARSLGRMLAGEGETVLEPSQVAQLVRPLLAVDPELMNNTAVRLLGAAGWRAGQKIVHLTSKGWDVLDAGPLEEKLPRVIARRGHDVLSLDVYPKSLQDQYPAFYEHCKNAALTVRMEGLDEVQVRGIFLNQACVGYYLYGAKADPLIVGITFLVFGPDVNLRDQGMGAAVLMDAVYQTHQAGGQVAIFEVINPRAFRNILVREGYGASTVHLQGNPVFTGASARPRSPFQRREVAVQDLGDELLQSDLFNMPEILHKIVVAR